MRIAYFIGTIRREDGVARVLLALAAEALANGDECCIVTGSVEEGVTTPVPVILIPSVTFPLYKGYRLPLPGMWWFSRKLDAFHPDVLHVHSPDTSARAAIRYARSRRVPIVATHHTDFVRYLPYYHLEFLESFVWWLLRGVFNRVDGTTTPSAASGEDLKSHGVKNVSVIGWGIDLVRFDPSFKSVEWRAKMLREGQKAILICVCRLTWEKDLATLADAVARLRATRNDFSMVIAGDGPARAGLEARMPGTVFLGHIEKDELSRAYASSDILFFPSSTETFGNVTAEGMVSGLVPVVANAGGSKAIVREGVDGFLVRPQDADSFAAVIAKLLDDPALRERMRASALELRSEVSWTAVFKKVRGLYASVGAKDPR